MHIPPPLVSTSGGLCRMTPPQCVQSWGWSFLGSDVPWLRRVQVTHRPNRVPLMAMWISIRMTQRWRNSWSPSSSDTPWRDCPSMPAAKTPSASLVPVFLRTGYLAFPPISDPSSKLLSLPTFVRLAFGYLQITRIDKTYSGQSYWSTST